MTFKYTGLADIKHLNIRKQGVEEDRDMAVDVKLYLKEVPASICAPLFGHDSADEFIAAFWLDDEGVPDDEKALRFSSMTEIKVWTFYQRQHEFKVGSISARMEKLHKFTLEVRGGQKVDITLTASIINPSNQLIQYLADHVMDATRIKILPEDLFSNHEKQAVNQ